MVARNSSQICYGSHLTSLNDIMDNRDPNKKIKNNVTKTRFVTSMPSLIIYSIRVKLQPSSL